MSPSEKLETWEVLSAALKRKAHESLQQAALRLLKRGSPNWAAAQVVLRATPLRDEAAWRELARARKLLREHV
jgi:hypothetical protein